MDKVIGELHASHPQPMSFAPSLHIRAFLLPRDDGNLLVYSAPSANGDARAVEDLGGVARHYLNHWHEAAFGFDSPDRAFGAPLYVSEGDRDAVAAERTVDEVFAGPDTIGADFEVIPIPGHTSGATAFLWDGGDHRFLFTGDSIYLDDGEWVAAVLDSSDRGAYIESLELMRDLDFDVLVPWVASAGQPAFATTDRADSRRRIDAILERVRRGDEH